MFQDEAPLPNGALEAIDAHSDANMEGIQRQHNHLRIMFIQKS